MLRELKKHISSLWFIYPASRTVVVVKSYRFSIVKMAFSDSQVKHMCDINISLNHACFSHVEPRQRVGIPRLLEPRNFKFLGRTAMSVSSVWRDGTSPLVFEVPVMDQGRSQTSKLYIRGGEVCRHDTCIPMCH